MIFFYICLSIEFIFLSFIYIHFFNLLKIINFFQIFNNNILNIKKYPLFISPYNYLNFIFLFSLKLKRLPL